MRKIIPITLIVATLIIFILSLGLIGLITFSFMGGCYVTDYPAEQTNYGCIQFSEEKSCAPYLVKNNCDKNYFILSQGLEKEEEITLEKERSVFAIPKINSESTPPWQLKITDNQGEEIIVNGKTNYEQIENNARLKIFYYVLIIVSIVSIITFLFSLFKLVKN